MDDRKKSHMPLFWFLKFVKLPDLQCSNEESCAINKQSLGRLDPEGPKVFDYLRSDVHGKKKVTHIDKVIVPDCTIHPHSDEEIRRSLAGLRIRSLDWRKQDLSITALRDILSGVESLHLQSSGNEDILSYWAQSWITQTLKALTITISRVSLYLRPQRRNES